MTAYRLYRKALPGSFALTLMHGRENHESYDLFDAQHLIHPIAERGQPGFGAIWRQYQFIERGRQWVRENASRFDVFHGLQGFDLTVRPAIEAERCGLPAVVKLAAHRADFADKPGWRGILGRPRQRRKLAERLSAIIAISTDIRDELLGYGFPESKIALIPNGVDTDQFRPCRDADARRELREQLGWPDRPTILFVGTLVPRKRPHLLVQALAELGRRKIDAQLVLAGPPTDAAYVEQMKQIAVSTGVAEQVIWSGFNAEVAPLYRAADVFALPSSSEGMPNALLEAMASGLACLATEISGSRDLVIDGKTGLMAEPDSAAIAETLSQLLDPSAAHLGQNALDFVHQSYSTAVVLEEHAKLFRRLTAGG